MEQPTNIVLTGFMGTGKSTVGRTLAELTGRKFLDTDAIIVERHGPIAEIFAAEGEPAFRAIERSLANELAAAKNLLISTGGRMMLDRETAAALVATSRTFCLTAAPSTIVERLTIDGGLDERPLLAGSDPAGRIVDLLAERSAGYARFEQVSTDGRSAQQVADEIVRRLDGQRRATSVSEVVSSGLCVGCGLCEAVTEHRVTMGLDDLGRMRPAPLDSFSPEEEALIVRSCPGTVARSRVNAGATDAVWGTFSDMRYAWAGDPDVRFKAATGGALTALGMHALESGMVEFVLHVGSDPEHPMRSRWVMSESPADVRANTGSRYGPTAPLAGLFDALDRGERFAIIAKPCDLGAVHALSASDPRVDELCVARLTMVCGGQSTLEKSTAVLADFEIAESEVSLFRYRGYGNPGPTRIETHDGRSFEVSYNELWEDESGWKLESRCTICPDALGEAADVAAGDVWPGGGPTGEDEGFNGIVVRSNAGAHLVSSAVAAGALVLGDEITVDMYNDFQPHQVRKKIALASRNDGLTAADHPTIATDGLRVDVLAEQLPSDRYDTEVAGTTRRVEQGRYSG